MRHIQGISRNQLHLSSLEDKIASDNPVRFIDAFVECIDLQKVGDVSVFCNSLENLFRHYHYFTTFEEKKLHFFNRITSTT